MKDERWKIVFEDLMDCVIKIIKAGGGPDEGQEFRLSGGETILGRSPRAQVRLNHPQVSFEHAVVTRTGDEYFIENLSALGTLVNEQKIAGKVKLREKDKVQLGPELVLRVEAAPGAGRAARQRKLLLMGIGGMMVLLLGVVLLDPFGQKSVQRNWRQGYMALTGWVQVERDAGRLHLSDETLNLMQEAWRMQKAGDRKGAAKVWLQLKVLLAASDPETHFVADSGQPEYRGAVWRLIADKAAATQLDNKEMGAALVEFVDEQLRICQ
jgi:pSer/pThr/pTyr-binding forkhead associated (FHA) protein